MEEILASIRRIISDDQSFTSARPTARAAAPVPVVPKPVAPPVAAVPLRAPAPPPPESAPVDARPPVMPAPAPLEALLHVSTAYIAAPAALPAFEAHQQPQAAIEGLHMRGSAPVHDQAPLETNDVSDADWDAERHDAIDHAPASSEPDLTPLVSPATDAAVSSAFGTLVASHFLQNSGVLNDMAREMLRPMLKSWLDDNLPIMVERLVRAEIERVARGGR